MTQKQRQEYQKLQVYIWALQQKNWPLEGINRQQAYAEVITIAQVLEITLDPTTDNQFFPTVSQKIFEVLSAPNEVQAPNIPPSEILEADIDDEIHKWEEKKLNLVFPTLPEQIKKIQKDYKDCKEKASEYLIKEKSLLSQNPLLLKVISQEISLELANKTPQVAREETLSEKDYQKNIETIKPKISEEFKKIGFKETEVASDKNFEESASHFAKTISTIPRITTDVEKIIELEQSSLIPKEIPPLPKEILIQINQPQQTVVLPSAYIFLHPKVTAAFLKKAISTPEAALIKIAVENAPLSWQQDKNWNIIKEIVTKRVFAEDLQATVDWLKEKGFGEHPLTKKLEDRVYEFKAVQKDPRNNKDLPWVTRLKRSSHFDELLGGKRVYSPYLGTLPRLANEPIWSEENSYGAFLHRGLNRFRFIPNISQRSMRFVTGGRYESFGGFIKKTLYQKTVRPALIRLGKTAAGNAFKRFAVGTASRLGLGAATGGWSLLISSLPTLKRMAKKALAFFGGLLLMAAHYGAAALTGTVVGGIGGVIGGAWLGFKIGASFGAFFGPLGGAIGAITGLVVGGLIGFFSGIGIQILIDKVKNFFATSSIPSKITSTSTNIAVAGGHSAGTVVLTTVASAGIGALMVTQITASSFVIPESEEFAGSPYIQLNKTGEFIGDEETGKGIITYEVSIGAQDESLIEIDITDKISSRCANEELEILKESISSPPETITPNNPWNFSYKATTSENFKDCLIINTVTVFAKTESQPEETQEKAITNVVKIGNPPDDCPYGWPTSGTITSLPGEDRGNHVHQGIDIANEKGTTIHSSHGGSVNSGQSSSKGNFVEIVGTCNGTIFSTAYFHLSKIVVSSDDVIGCDQIGEMGSTGNSTGPHLHYEIKGLGNDWWRGKFFPQPSDRDFILDSCS